ncbi:MAG TPA: dTDP-4-dehydrorhamnose 3,5-epimerase [Methanospirillum sp.]|nr:dTDP-4-dehydrorhamnose 3,5-epimerase [Methanospirillum sp.]
MISIRKTQFEGVLLIEPQVFEDSRGFFIESYNQRDFSDAGIPDHFVQDNHSRSQKGVLRGLHYQYPYSQGKLLRVLRGSVYDVIVDIRVGSPTYGAYLSVTLTETPACIIYIAPGFAHGFLVLEDNTEVMYKVTDFYYPEGESGILWNDPELNILWPLGELGIDTPVVSDKDKKHLSMKEFISPFIYSGFNKAEEHSG